MKPDKVLWLGTYVFENEFEILLHEKTYVQTAANRVQGYYLNELNEQLNTKIDVISSLVTQSYPISPRKKISRWETQNGKGIKVINTGFTNKKYFSILSQCYSVLREVDKWIESIDDNELLWVVVYSVRLPILLGAKHIKEKHLNTVVINIVPDLPQFMHPEKDLLRSVLSVPYQSALRHTMKCVDGYVLYTKYMREVLDITNNYVVIEGLFSINEVKREKNKNNEKTIIVYAGGLEKSYGVEALVEGFCMLENDDVELHLYGNGTYVENLIEISKRHNNVMYKGLVSPSEAFSKICAADLVVNPRKSSEEYTKYSFPSKTFEYLASGTPTLMTRLPGIGEEYFEHVYSIEEESAVGISNALRAVLSIPKSEREQKGEEAKEFVLRSKNTSIQTKKLIDFMLSFQERK